jgi:hypothetical protein
MQMNAMLERGGWGNNISSSSARDDRLNTDARIETTETSV